MSPPPLIEHLYAPYCAGFRIIRLLESVYGLAVISYNVVELRDGSGPSMPPYIEARYREIVNGGRIPFGGLFFVNGQYMGSAFQDLVFNELDRLGVPRLGLPPQALKHPRLRDQGQASGTLLIKAVTQDDLSGTGNPSPAYCTELQFGPEGNPETVGLLAGWIGRYGCCMLGAYIGGQAAGFVTFAPREEVWKLGYFEAGHEPPQPGEAAEVLTVLCLHVYPGVRRQGVATALITELVEYARDHAYRQIVAYAGMRSMKSVGQSAGNRYPYERSGFTLDRVLVQPGEPRYPHDTSSRQYQGLARLVYNLEP
jgi:GNAT superfamily N-acetyltransferase